MRKLAGLITRQKMSLVLPNFNSLKEGGKQKLFKDYIMPFLEFNEKMAAFKRSMNMIAKSWRSHKSKLVNQFMLKGRSPFQNFKYLKKEDWEEFVKVKSMELFQHKSEKFKQIRKKNKHPHRLGTTGYDGKLSQWQAEDDRLVNEGRSNPWLQFPGRSKNLLRARGTLTYNGEISFKSQKAMEVSDKIRELTEDSSFKGDGEADPLSTALGIPEHSGRVRGISSYDGWKLQLPEYGKRRKITEVDMEKLTEQIRAKVTQDIIANITSILAAQGLQLAPIAASPHQIDSVDAYKSSCASASAPDKEHDLYVEMMQHTKEGQQESDLINLLSEPTPCSLLQIVDGFQVEISRGQVYPQQKVLHIIPVCEGDVVVSVDFVNSKYWDRDLEVLPNDETRTVGQALMQRVQWRREHIVINRIEKDVSVPVDPTKGANKPSKLKSLSESQKVETEKGANLPKSTSKVLKKKVKASSIASGSATKSSKKTRDINTKDKCHQQLLGNSCCLYTRLPHVMCRRCSRRFKRS